MRLFNFPIRGSSHSVVNLPIHLEGCNLIRRGNRTKLTVFFNLCARDPERTTNLLYKDVPKKYRWMIAANDGYHTIRMWLLWGGWYMFPPGSRAILPPNFVVSLSITQFIRRYSYAGYLENDREWEECLAETVSFKMPYALRQLFGIIVVYSLPDHASALWDRFKNETAIITLNETRKLQMAECKYLKWVAEYLLSNRKTLEMYGLAGLSTYRDDFEDVEREDTDRKMSLHTR
ncbi:LOW QUALITY PROTEIN: Helitron helicase [Phytophthora megakarya]|uniref:Helitron helicase n=1 Tax=Phytophthora megakarya TaxID=4795 RepID=A0A225WLQ2_9STRA|nr:LOW QUALITY PROTEIN: Helitron helicase [Phytophthora megakarya]